MLIILIICAGNSWQVFHFIDKRPTLRFDLSSEDVLDELIEECMMCHSDKIKLQD